MKVEKRQTGLPVKMWTDGVEVERGALEQLHMTASLPFVHHHVAVMPDVHYGIGATVGSVIPFTGAIVPAAVGVDIGCGMVARKLLAVSASNLPDNLEGVRTAIEAAVPVGFNHHGDTIPKHVGDLYRKFCGGWESTPVPETLNNLKPRKASPQQQLGTLGGGNHFIEICLDENDEAWLMLHSGSRGIGNAIGQHFIAQAKRECEKWGVKLPHRDLAYLPENTPGFDSYVDAVGWAQEYAHLNRVAMVTSVLQAVREYGYTLAAKEESNPFGWIMEYAPKPEEAVNCHHNYVERESHFGKNVWLTRKGAVRAREGDLGIIPGSMGAKSFIVRGKGNPESFNSCSHGAGRRMSRTVAKSTFTVADHIKATEGVECRKDKDMLDETPGAYKDIDAVMAAQSDLVDIVHTLRQVVCVKG